MFSENPKVWVSLEAQNKWVKRFKTIIMANIETCLKGVCDGYWQNRTLSLYGNAKLHFMSKAKQYNSCYSNKFREQSHLHEIGVYRDKDGLNTRASESVDSRNPVSLWSVAEHTNATCLTENRLTVSHNVLSVIFWQDMGLSLFSGLPKHLMEPSLIALIEHHLKAMLEYGFEEQATYLREILTWPVEWSTLNGIEEIRTPLVKMARVGDPSVGKKTIQMCGADYPVEGADGLCFPFNQKGKRAFSESRYFQKGLETNVIRIVNA